MTRALPSLTNLAHRGVRAQKAISALERNEQIIVIDDLNDRETCGYLVAGAAHATAAMLASMVRYSSGFVCVALNGDTCDRLDLPAMEGTEQQSSTQSHPCVTVDAIQGTTTGISAHDRAYTAALLANPHATREDFTRPGHVVPVRTADGGLLTRQSIAEAASFLSDRAGHGTAALFAAAVGENEQAGLPHEAELEAFATAHRLSLVTLSDVHTYMLAVTPVVRRDTATRVLGQQVITYVGPTSSDRQHVTVIGPTDPDTAVPLYLHLGSPVADDADNLHRLEETERSMMATGRGITVHVANDQTPDRRALEVADSLPFVVASILNDLGVQSVSLLNGDRRLRTVLDARGIKLRESMPVTSVAWPDERTLHAS
ncbi:3,4-dihydroxy-2-butanone-4-phosphate synthase [Gordonia sp. C13]|uniref:3,4-dihydroxy-2-butanone-4-phosphate synthase n=1 Tax=Gordonia sp. C13 TaxID=2935078 RepID=UPI00200B0646|nr:3,4-dihydroxy-2-butanone-4-phosphate synthase [Gordonia sp. C13]MCK8616694.1 3,4-dihydroxy-2-butanone-4-phosphate synthase [Gordonia sp. C13]